MTDFYDLPMKSVWIEGILPYLDKVSDVVALGRTCRFMHEMLFVSGEAEEVVWKRLFVEKWGDPYFVQELIRKTGTTLPCLLPLSNGEQSTQEIAKHMQCLDLNPSRRDTSYKISKRPCPWRLRCKASIKNTTSAQHRQTIADVLSSCRRALQDVFSTPVSNGETISKHVPSSSITPAPSIPAIMSTLLHLLVPIGMQGHVEKEEYVTGAGMQPAVLYVLALACLLNTEVIMEDVEHQREQSSATEIRTDHAGDMIDAAEALVTLSLAYLEEDDEGDDEMMQAILSLSQEIESRRQHLHPISNMQGLGESGEVDEEAEITFPIASMVTSYGCVPMTPTLCRLFHAIHTAFYHAGAGQTPSWTTIERFYRRRNDKDPKGSVNSLSRGRLFWQCTHFTAYYRCLHPDVALPSRNALEPSFHQLCRVFGEEKDSQGLSAEAFVRFYERQGIEEPEETLRDLLSLGVPVDRNMNDEDIEMTISR